jgi:hypothetical protein
MKSFPAPFIFVKRNMGMILAVATDFVMSSEISCRSIGPVILTEAERTRGSRCDGLILLRDSSTTLAMTRRCQVPFRRLRIRPWKS